MTKKPIYAVTDYDGCPYITARKAYRVVERHSEDDFWIVDDEGDTIYISACASSHFEGEAGWHIIDTLQDEQTAQDQDVTLRPGDYVRLRDIKDGLQQSAIAQRFIDSGATPGLGYPYSNDPRSDISEVIFWDQISGMVNRGIERHPGASRALSVDQVLGRSEQAADEETITPAQVIAAAPAAPTPERQFKVGDRVRVNGYRHDQPEHEHYYGTSRTMKQWEREGTILEVACVKGDRVDAGAHCFGLDYSFHPSELDLVQDEPATQTPDHPTQPTRSERAEWARYAAAALTAGKSPADAAMAAEELMRIRRERLSG